MESLEASGNNKFNVYNVNYIKVFCTKYKVTTNMLKVVEVVSSKETKEELGEMLC